jgi:hypothetical protein
MRLTPLSEDSRGALRQIVLVDGHILRPGVVLGHLEAVDYED